MKANQNRHPFAPFTAPILAVTFAAAYVLPYVDWSASVPVGVAGAAPVGTSTAASSGDDLQGDSQFHLYVAWLHEAHATAALHGNFAESPSLL
jgi:hypothetical protein